MAQKQAKALQKHFFLDSEIHYKTPFTKPEKIH